MRNVGEISWSVARNFHAATWPEGLVSRRWTLALHFRRAILISNVNRFARTSIGTADTIPGAGRKWKSTRKRERFREAAMFALHYHGNS